MKSFKDYINETYRITPDRRNFLRGQSAAARSGAESGVENPNRVQGRRDIESNMAKMNRIDAIHQMGLPANRRVGTASDAKLKGIMKASRATQQAIQSGKKEPSFN